MSGDELAWELCFEAVLYDPRLVKCRRNCIANKLFCRVPTIHYAYIYNFGLLDQTITGLDWIGLDGLDWIGLVILIQHIRK